MRVAMFDFVTHYGGAQRVLVEVAARLKNQLELVAIDPYGCCGDYVSAVHQTGLKLEVLLPRASRTTLGQGHGLPRRLLTVATCGPGLARLARRLRKAVRRFAPDIIWTSSFKAVGMLTAAMPFSCPPIVCYLQGWCRPETVDPITRWLFRRRVAHFQALCESSRANLVSLGVQPERISIVPIAIDVPALRQAAERPLSQPLPRANSPIRLVLPASLLKAKGQECAVRALGRLVAAGQDAVLYLAGDVPDIRQPAFKQQLEQQIRQQGLAERVFLLGWRNDLPAILRACTMVVLPSHTEGLPRVIMEAMALERPVAATPVGGVPDLIQPVRTGWLFPIEDDAALAQAVLEAHRADVRKRVTASALEHIAGFSFQRQLSETLRAFELAAGEKQVVGRRQ